MTSPGQKLYQELMDESSKPDRVNSYCNERLVVIDKLLSPEECALAIESFAPYPMEKGVVGIPAIPEDREAEYTHRESHALRNCYVTYAPRTDDNRWLHEKLEQAMLEANAKYWQCEITDFSQPIRMMTYEKGHHFGALHQDFGPHETCFRKLTAVLQVSNPADYEGGEFDMPGEPMPPEAFNQGSLLVFPAYLVHRAKPVTAGLRQTVIHRAIGPWFR